MGSYGIVMLYFLIDAIKQRVKNDKDMEKFYYFNGKNWYKSNNKKNRNYLEEIIFKYPNENWDWMEISKNINISLIIIDKIMLS